MIDPMRWLKKAIRRQSTQVRSTREASLTRSRRCRIETLEELVPLTAVPTGTNIQIQSQNQNLNQTNPDVAKDPVGDFVVVWEQVTAEGNRDIFGRRFFATGTPKGTEFGIVTTTQDQYAPRVDMAGDGSFVVVWEEVDTGGETDIFFRRFDSSGNAISLPTLANPADTVDQTDPDIAVFPTGTFVITWTNATTATNSDIQFRRFVSNGSPLDAAARNLANTAQNETQGRIAANKAINADRFMVVWTEATTRGDTDVMRDMRSIFTGNTISGAGVVSDNAATQNLNHSNPSVDLDVVGNAVVTYAEEVTPTNNNLYLRRYNNLGVAQTTNRQVVEDQASLDTKVSQVGIAGNSTFVVTYVTENGTDGTSDLSYQRFAADGSKFAGPQEVLLPPHNPGNQTVPQIAMNGVGDFTIVWEDDVFKDVFGDLTYARNFRTPLDTIGLYNPASATFFLRNSNTTGTADIQPFNLGTIGPPRWYPIAGDWNGDGVTTIGVYEPTGATFFLRNSNTVGVADITINFGSPNWIPVAGDWDGDGIDTIGAYDRQSSTFYLRNSNTTGVADITANYGPTNLTWTPVAGDWNGDGIDTIGLYNPQRGVPSTGRFLLRNTNTSGVADVAFNFNSPNLKPVVGDWNRDGVDTIGTFNPATAVVSLRNSNNAGGADIEFTYGASVPPLTEAWIAIAGDWNGPGAAGLVTSTAVPSSDLPESLLDAAQLDSVVNEAIARWELAGLSADQAATLAQVSIVVADLPGNYLGVAQGNKITLDNNAAGHGWFVDLTPGDDDEYAEIATELVARSDTGADGRVDLLTAVSHEFGHLLGLEHSHGDPSDVMLDTLLPGIRRLPDAAAIDRLLG